jgi:importin subunit beta-1
MNVSEILLSAQSPDQTIRTQAEAVLNSACDNDFATFASTLATHLATPSADAESRRLAGIILKNNLDAKSPDTRAFNHARWSALDTVTVRPAIRAALLQALAAPEPAPRRAAAQVVAKVAAIELPVPGAWDTVVTDLLAASTGEGSPNCLRQAALETLGYICEDAAYGEIAASVLASHSNAILTAVIHGMTYGVVSVSEGADTAAVEAAAAKSAESADVRLAATCALNNALEFARSQFEVDNERVAIMKTVYTAAKSADERIRQAAFEGLVKIGEHYYDKLPEYIQWLYELTEHAIRTDTENVALQGIEFWSTICEEEIALIDEAATSQELGISPDRVSKSFVSTALPYLGPSILNCLKLQEEDPLDDETWNRATAAGACLELLAQAAPIHILPIVMPFVETNISDTDNWRSREAAILAFGSVLDGPPAADVKTLVKSAFPILMTSLLSDSHMAVRDTAAWTLARVVQVDSDTTIANLVLLVECLRGALTRADNPVVAAHVCYAIHNLAECFLAEANNETGSLVDHAEVILRVLLIATAREDAGEGNLRTTAYEALNMMLRAVALDSIPLVQSVLPMLLEKLESTLQQFKTDLSEDDVMELLEIQGLLCGALTTATQRLQQGAGWDQLADRMMAAYLQVLGVNRSSAVHEEALLAIGAVADAAGPQFSKYMQHLAGPLTTALGNHEHYQVCAVAIAVVGDVCRALGPQIMIYADNVVYLLLDALQSKTLDKTVKPPILSCFGDVAMAAKGDFHKYLPQVMARMQQAAESSIQVDVALEDYDMQDWLLSLRESIFEAYIGIVNGLGADNKQSLLMPYVEWLLQFCEVVVSPESPNGHVGSELLVKAASGVLGDLVDALPAIRTDLSQRSWIQQLVERGGQSKDIKTREMASFAQQTIFMAN